ncbi:putative triacylglycerol lipase [Helianthus anomalus]
MEFRAQKRALLVIYVAVLSILTTSTNGGTIVPIFIFGDSTMDVGTNNHVANCSSTANHPYNGIDYPGSQATGRYSNGLNTADSIVQLLGGYDLSPLPYLSLVEDGSNFTRGIFNGVNFASGGAGLGKLTVQQFATVQGNITALLGKSKGDRLLQKSMYIFSVGSNDIMEYYFTYPRIMTPEQFVINLTDTYAIHLKKLYSMGARKFGILSIPPIGCCPAARFASNGTCVNELNDLARACHASFESLTKNMSCTLEGFKYSLANTYNMTMSVITQKIGKHMFSFYIQRLTYSISVISLVSTVRFKDVVSACCADNSPFGLSECLKGVHLCKYRDDYLFWDKFHPTQKASKLAATVVVSSQDPAFVSPINFGSLRKA